MCVRLKTDDHPKISKEKIRSEIHKDKNFISASEIFKNLPKEQQTSLREWFDEQAEGEKPKIEGGY